MAVVMTLSGEFAMAGRASSSAGGETLPDSLINMLEEVDVVAVKYANDYRNAPVGGTLLGGKHPERLDIRDAKSVSGVVPNFYIPDYGSRITSSIYVRGIGARMDQPGVGLSVDNVGILNKDAYDFDMSDIASVEMLRGPQSSLFGRNTMTGLISIRTLSPMNFQGWRGAVQLGLQSRFRLNLGWYHKFSPKAGLSIAGSFYRYGGHFKNEYNGQPVDREINGSLRVKFHFNPTEKVSVDNSLSTSILRQGGYAYASVKIGEINYNDTCFYRRFLFQDGLSVTANIGNLKLMSVTSVQHINDNMTLDQDFTPEPYFTLTQKKNETAITEDLMLRGNAAGGKYSWLAGVYGFFRHMGMTAPVTFKDYGIKHLIEDHRNEANPYYPIAWESRSFLLNSDFILPSGGAAIYHESRYEAGSWRFTAGLRLDYEHVAMRYDSHCHTGYSIFRNPTGELPFNPAATETDRRVDVELREDGRLSHDYLMLLPKVSVMKAFPELDESNVYLSVGKGYKAGGFNTQMFSDVLQQKLMQFMGFGEKYDVNDIVSYKPEKLWNYEIGTHINLLKGRMMLDASVFFIDCRDQQLTRFPEGQTTGRMMTNAGKTRSFGGELSLSWTPFERFLLMASYGFTDARFVEYNDGKNDYKGKRLPYSPANTLYGRVSYGISCSTTNKYFLNLALDFNGVGDIYWNESNTLKQNFYGLMGASVMYETPRWSVEVWGKNLTGTKYNTFYFMSMGNEFYQKGNPVSFGVTLRAKF